MSNEQTKLSLHSSTLLENKSKASKLDDDEAEIKIENNIEGEKSSITNSKLLNSTSQNQVEVKKEVEYPQATIKCFGVFGSLSGSLFKTNTSEYLQTAQSAFRTLSFV